MPTCKSLTRSISFLPERIEPMFFMITAGTQEASQRYPVMPCSGAACKDASTPCPARGIPATKVCRCSGLAALLARQLHCERLREGLANRS